MVFNTTFNNISVISWQSVLLVEETWVPGENHWPVTSHWQTLSHNVVSSTPRHEQGFKLTTSVVIGTDCIGSCKSNYHITMMAPQIFDWQFKFTDESMLFHWNCIEIYAKLQYEMPQAWNIIFCQWIKFVKFQRMFHGLVMSGIHRKKKKKMK